MWGLLLDCLPLCFCVALLLLAMRCVCFRVMGCSACYCYCYCSATATLLLAACRLRLRIMFDFLCWPLRLNMLHQSHFNTISDFSRSVYYTCVIDTSSHNVFVYEDSNLTNIHTLLLYLSSVVYSLENCSHQPIVDTVCGKATNFLETSRFSYTYIYSYTHDSFSCSV